MTRLATVAPIRVGQRVTIHSGGEELAGTVIELAPLDGSRWEIWVEVHASFGISTSRHIVDVGGVEDDLRPHGLALVGTGA